MMDFCCEDLGTTVEVLQPCLDGYEVSNLISNNPGLRKMGYLAERFIKPPVNIVFTFPCPIEFSHVLITPSVGKHKTVGLNLMSGIYQSKCDTGKYEEVELGKCYLKTEDHICFVNKLFKNRLPFSDLECERLRSLNSSPYQRSMKGSMLKPLQSARKLKVCIWRTQDASLPALGRISIFAIPSRNTDKLLVENLLRLWRTATDDSAETTVGESTHELEQTIEQPIKNEDLEKVIPSEFLDPITSSIMTYPIILPSGNIIDQTTLDKYISAEKSWARQPNDPFTGLPFTKDRRLIPNTALKSRIDSFLLLHDDLCSERTVGRKSTRPQCDSDADVSHLDNNDLHNSLVNKKIIATGYKKRIVEKTTTLSPEACDTNCANGEPSFENHKRRLDGSLDAALKTTLNSLTSFTCQPNGYTVWKTEQETRCIICNKSTKSLALYYLPCSHVVCRSCSQSQENCPSSTRHCPHCNKSFSSSSMYRIH